MKVTPDDYGRRCQFDHFCKLVLYHEAVDYFRERKLRVALHTGLNLIGIGTQSDEIFPVRACSEKAYAPIQKIKYSGDHDFHIYLRSHSICRPSPLLTNAFHTNLPPRYYLTFMQKSQRSLPRPSVMLLSQISFGCSPV